MKVLFRVLALCGLACVAHAQMPRPAVFRFTTDHGLPQNSVKEIAFDRWGFCWLATEMGLVRYDGRSFTAFGTAEIKGLHSERIVELSVDRRGNLYGLASVGQVLEIKGQSVIMAPAPQLNDGREIYVSHEGIAVSDKAAIAGVRRFYAEKPGSEETGTASLPNGDIYFFNNSYLKYLPAGQASAITVETHPEREGITKVPVGTDLYLAIQEGNRVEAWRKGRRVPGLTTITGSIEAEPGVRTGRLEAFYNQSGTFIYFNNNLHKLSVVGNRVVSAKVLEHIVVPALNCVYYAAEQGRYYLGSLTDGLFVVQPSRFTYPEIPDDAGDASFYGQVKGSDSTLFARDLLFTVGRPARKLPLGSVLGSGMDFSKDGVLYFQKSDIVATYDTKTGKRETLWETRHRLVYLRSDGPHPGDYRFFTVGEAGTSVGGVIAKKQLPQQLVVISVTETGPSKYLLGTETGLKWYDYESNRITRSLLDSIPVRAARPEGADRIWIATYGKGFFLYEKGRLYKMPLGPHQALKTVHSFIDDGKGFFWLPTNNGLFKVQKARLLEYAAGKRSDVYFFWFNTNDGLITNEFNGGADRTYTWLKDSLLSLSSLKGLVWFHPNRITPGYPDKRIYIDSLRIDDQPVTLQGRKVLLDPDFATLSLRVSSPYFGNTENMNLQYMLKGADDRWHPVGRDGVLRMNHLPAGQYAVYFRRTGPDNAGGEAMVEILVEVKPHFYETWWFFVISAAVLIFVFFGISQWRTRNLRRKSEELEKVVSSRTDELRSAVEDLARSEMALLESNRVKDKMIVMVLHDLRSPLRFISLISGRLLKSPAEVSKAELNESLSDLYAGTQNLLGFTEQFFLWISSQQQGFRVKKTVFELQSLFDEVTGLYSDILRINRNRLVIETPAIKCCSDYQILVVIMRNLIDNANKYTSDGTICLSAIREGDDLVITVRDTGAGMSDAQIASFMNKDRSLSNRETGSFIIHGMLVLIDGSITVTSAEGAGSTFTIRLQNQSQCDAAGQDGSVPAHF